jgi:hypothetical protein
MDDDGGGRAQEASFSIDESMQKKVVRPRSNIRSPLKY